MMQLSEATLMRRLRVAKVPRGPRIKRVPTMEALALYRSGVSVAELAKRFAVSPSWIRHELHKAGVRFTLGRPKGTFDGRPHEFAVDIDRIAPRHREGKTIQEIADEMGLSRSVVHRRLRQRGLSRAVGPRSRVRPDDVGRMYWGEGLEAHEVAKALAVTPSTVTRKLKVAGLPRRAVGAAANPPIYISPGLKALIAGLLLGDGYLCPNSKASPVSCALVLGQRVDRLEWLEQVRSAFAAEGVDCLPIRRTSVMDHRSGRRQHAVTLSTRFYRELLAERRRWYPEGTKVVPTDLRLTPTTLAHWYWGDGHCSHAKSVGLATNAFPIPDVMRLVAELKARWGWHARVSASGTGPVIMISRREDVRAFVHLVRPMAPSCFKYKVPEVPDDGRKTRSERYGRSAFVGRSLNAAQVRDLRLKRSHGARWCDLGREFGIQPNTAKKIVNRQTYRDVE